MHFFFFKQKTAYEMRISDWSSDVCSSDLSADPRTGQVDALGDAAFGGGKPTVHGFGTSRHRASLRRSERKAEHQQGEKAPGRPCQGGKPGPKDDKYRSEEHTSELQSLMRNSYAGF